MLCLIEKEQWKKHPTRNESYPRVIWLDGNQRTKKGLRLLEFYITLCFHREESHYQRRFATNFTYCNEINMQPTRTIGTQSEERIDTQIQLIQTNNPHLESPGQTQNQGTYRNVPQEKYKPIRNNAQVPRAKPSQQTDRSPKNSKNVQAIPEEKHPVHALHAAS